MTMSSAAAAPASACDKPPVWDLTPLYDSPECEAFAADAEEAASAASAFRARYAGTVADAAPETLETMLKEFARIEHLLMKMNAYAYLRYSEDGTDPQRGAFYQQTSEHVSACAENLIFFTLELNIPDDAYWERAFSASQYLNRHRSWIKRQRNMRPYQLSEGEERAFMMKDVTGASAWQRLFDETMAHLEVTLHGEQRPLQDALHLLQSAKKDERDHAFSALCEALRGKADVLTYITNTLMKDKALEDAKRDFSAPIQSRNLDNDIEDEAVEALLTAVESRYGDISHRYYAWKAKRFGVERLDYADRNAPIPGHTEEPPLPWNDAKHTVLDAYRAFSDELADIGETIFHDNRIHALPQKGKDSGAYSHPTVPEACPYILMNYKGTQRDVMTLAHELGHGVHQILCKHHGVLLADTPLTVAETASVFGEQLTFRALLSKADTPEQKEKILTGKIEDMINTVVRQAAFCRFEQALHDARADGELTKEVIGAIWQRTQQASLGDAVHFPDDAHILWSYIPHFIHTPFYVYAYAFGDCLVNSLYRVYTRSPEGFVDTYLDVLRAGGSKRYDILLEPFNLNPKDPAFWHEGLDMIAGLMDELEAL